MKTFVVIPTYNEAQNIEGLISQISNLNIKDLFVLVVDDNSQDGTGNIVQRFADKDNRIILLKRHKKRGRGIAGIDGFKYALDAGADYIIEMDADFSHDPKYIPGFLNNINNYDVVLGSRFIEGGKDIRRSFKRRIITRLAGIYTRRLLRIDVKDVSSGYRCFRRHVLERISLDDMISTGPSIILEELYKVILNGFSVKEMPIIFTDRKHGKTKLGCMVLFNTLIMVLRIRNIKKKPV